MNTQQSINRLAAHVRMDSDADAPRANCEECGAEIPVELTLCTDCEAPDEPRGTTPGCPGFMGSC